MQEADEFELPVTYSGEERLVKAALSTYGYLHRITVDVDGVVIYFEPDEERNYRAVLAEATSQGPVNRELVRAIIEALELNFKNG